MTASAHAWILTDLAGQRFAVANVEMVEYLTEAHIMNVPLSPDYCPAVMHWRERLLPIVFYHRLFAPGAAVSELHHIGIVAYQRHPGEPLLHLAVVLNQAPYRVVVTDEENEALPECYRDPVHSPLVRAVFSLDNAPVPVLDVNYLASSTLRESLEQQVSSPS